MKKFFNQDKVTVGIVAGLGSELIVALLLWIGLMLAGLTINGHERWFGAIFVPILLILRYYIKKTTFNVVVKTLMVVTFVTFVGFLFVIY